MVAPHKVSLASDVLLVWGYLLSLVTPFIGEPEYCEELISHRLMVGFIVLMP